MKSTPFFASDLSFLDPLKTSDGKPFGPVQFKKLVQECYIISKQTHTSYNEALLLTPTERGYILQFITDEIEAQRDAVAKMKSKK